MKRIVKFYVLLILLLTAEAFPQDVYSEQPSATINLMPVYENWSLNDSTDFSEFTSIISAGYNPLQNTCARSCYKVRISSYKFRECYK